MRTTLVIDDDVLEAARVIADHTRRSLGKVVSDLARRGLGPRLGPTMPGALPRFSVSEKARPFAPDAVQRGLDDDD